MTDDHNHLGLRAAQPHDDLEREIAAFWSTLLDTRSVGSTDGFWDLGGDSLDVVELAEFIESSYHVTLTYADLGESLSVATVAEAVRSRRR